MKEAIQAVVSNNLMGGHWREGHALNGYEFRKYAKHALIQLTVEKPFPSLHPSLLLCFFALQQSLVPS